MRGCPRGPATVGQRSGAPEFTVRTPASPCIFLTLPGWICWHSGHMSGAHTHPNPPTCTKYPRSPSRPGDSYAAFNALLKLFSTGAPGLPNFWPSSAPRGGASVTQPYVYQTETEHFLRVWHHVGYDGEADNTHFCFGEVHSPAFGLPLKGLLLLGEPSATGSRHGPSLCGPWLSTGLGTQLNE